MRLGNLGRDIDQLTTDVSWSDLADASSPLWQSVHDHPGMASCECPGIEFLARLYELGYRCTKVADGAPT